MKRRVRKINVRWPLTRKALERLRNLAPPKGMRVAVQAVERIVVDRQECFGACRFEDGRFHIRIDHTLDDYMARETLIHEFGHALADGCPWQAKHKGRFGPSWARAYRIALGEKT